MTYKVDHQAVETFQNDTYRIKEKKGITFLIKCKSLYFQMVVFCEFLFEALWKALPLPSFELLQLHFRLGLFGRRLGECGKSGLQKELSSISTNKGGKVF